MKSVLALTCTLLLMTSLVARGSEDPDLGEWGWDETTGAKPLPDHHSRRAHHSSKRLRHLRHLEGRSELPRAEALISNSLKADMNTVNAASSDSLIVDSNHKPVFTECSRYNPSFKEEEPAGTQVFKVEAIDEDPPEAGGSITYSFVLTASEQKKFDIDSHTGIITTKRMFDRDEPIREKEAYLTVRATDNGRPQLDDVCTFKVTITDINDNPPVFDKVNYIESVPQDLAPKREVMRISATDIDDGNNSIVQYDIQGHPQYFRIDRSTGVIFLERAIDKEPGFKFKLNATATDLGEIPNHVNINLEINIVESNKKAPSFSRQDPPNMPIYLAENRTTYSDPIVTMTADSNLPDQPELQFVLVTGRTEQTNKLNTFVMESSGSQAFIKQGKALDFETVSEYTLTVRVQNKDQLAAEKQITIALLDVNDNIPAFTEVASGSVLENEKPGMPVMQVRAIDGDGTFEHNQVSYELADNTELFDIDPKTGNITTKVEFDREVKDFYNVKVFARDNSPSAIYNTGKPNQAEQVFRIEIADVNDNKPKFTEKNYIAESIAEDANINALVTEVKAEDKDTASPVIYSILPEGNINNAFKIEGTTGKIRVQNQLDYETLTDYLLRVRAFDGKFEDFATVKIMIENVNDNRPVFNTYTNNITIEEEKKIDGCILNLDAYDPDISDRNAPQHIHYFVVKEDQSKLLDIDRNGCLSMITSLDRDPPDGYQTWQVLIGAKDEDGNSPNSLQSTTEVFIMLTDINDNAPFLNMPQPVVWYENQPPGNVASLIADDHDSAENGPPFTYWIDSSADADITTKFAITGRNLESLVTFDREEKKFYLIPIAISDSGSPSLTGTSTLTVEIGDRNDNAMKAGSSQIFVYNYKGEAPDTEIGRVYVDDPDDWDLPDKRFRWADNIAHPFFSLNANDGMITMNQGTADDTYYLNFIVREQATSYFAEHDVTATVNVTVKEIPEEAVKKSGSIRFMGISAMQFVEPGPGGSPSKQNILRTQLASYLNTSLENVDVFTVLHTSKRTNTSLLDVRFSAHGSPYYYPEKLNRLVSDQQEQLERDLGAKMLMVNIDECLIENDLCGTSSCSNFLNVQNEPYQVYTNTTSFIGVRAIVEPLCTCNSREPLICLNGGTPVGENCECMEGYEGPRCEVLAIGFNGDGWALYPSLQACEDSLLSLELTAHKETGLVFYAGPMRRNPHQDVQDFMSLELQDGYPVLMVDYGTGTVRGELKAVKLNDGQKHRIEVIWSTTGIEMKVDSCQKSDCFILKTPEGVNKFLNVNGPLQIGGTALDLTQLANQMDWKFKPTNEGFVGCIRNLTYNNKTYNLGMPSDSRNADPGCSVGIARAVSFGIDTNFLVAILVCVAILLILLLAVVVHRRKTDDMYKDMDDIRENIITYEDEGGGEIDAGFDMNVLRMYDSDGQPMLGKAPYKDNLQGGADEVPDICGFLDGKKQVCDADPETNPFDDVRHYAYEGDGNTSGSLSSLASGTDEGDLNFDYLSDFGPRFRKLADMYGEDPSDEEENFNNPASESWC